MVTTKRKTQKAVSSHIVACVKNFEVRSSAALNYDIHDIDRCRDDTPVYRYGTWLEIFGQCLEPKDRKGHEVKITVVGDDGDRWFTKRTLADYRRYDKDGHAVYKKRRGMERPVYDLPEGICTLDKVRGEPSWTTYLWTPTDLAMQWISILTTMSPLYLELHETRHNRQRWLRSVELVSTNSLEE